MEEIRVIEINVTRRKESSKIIQLICLIIITNAPLMDVNPANKAMECAAIDIYLVLPVYPKISQNSC